jgi:hypothetical protein
VMYLPIRVWGHEYSGPFFCVYSDVCVRRLRNCRKRYLWKRPNVAFVIIIFVFVYSPVIGIVGLCSLGWFVIFYICW